MARVRLMNRPEDFKNLGVNPNEVEPWEDGRRNDGAGTNEVWYFDAKMEDGTKVIAAFRPRSPDGMAAAGDSPNLNVFITMPDGTGHQNFRYVPLEESETRVGECHVKYGNNSVVGNLRTYAVKVEPVEGLGVDLRYDALVKPFRQGTACIALGDNDEYYYTDLNVPKCRVTGTITVQGQTHQVQGYGYHDHQWMNIHPFRAWHHWLWGRAYVGDYTVFIYDFVATEEFGFARIPMFGVLDKSGKVIFEGNGTRTLQADVELHPVIRKEQPKISRYRFENDGTTVELTVTWVQEIEMRDIYGKAPPEARAKFDQQGLQPTYARYFAEAELRITPASGTVSTAKGEMIYEYAYFGKPDERAFD